MLAGGAHVKIGNYEYLLDESMDNHYVHRFESLFVPRVQIDGSPGKQQIRPEKLLWSMDDWSGGEGNQIFYFDEPSVYDFSDGLNGRIRGQLTGRPKRTVTSVSYTDQRDRPVLAVADGALWLCGSRTLAYTTDGINWTSVSSGLTAGRITAAAGDHEYLYYTAYDSAGSGTRYLKRVSRSSAATDVRPAATGVAPYAGLAVMNGRLYAWTGRRMFELDIFKTLPLTDDDQRKVYDTGIDPPNTNVFGTQWWANCISTENSVFFFFGNDAEANLYELRLVGGISVGRPVWRGPYGFTMKSIAYQNGVVFMAGHWGGDENATGRGALYALPLDTRRPVFVSWFRKAQNLNLQMQELASSYGSQVMVAAARTGRIFIYDAELNAVSMLDDLETASDITFVNNDHRIGDMATFGTKRVVAVFRPGAAGAGTSIQLVAYDSDEPDDRETGYSQSLESPSWDYDFPHEIKALIGFHVAWKVEDTSTASGLKAGQTIQVEYKLDGDNWVSAGTISSATSPSGGVKGRHFIQVSDANGTRKFYVLKVRVTLAGSAGIQPPILYALTAESHLAAYAETWELVVRVKDELNRTRPSYRKWDGQTARDYLEDLAQNKNIVTFLDGYRYKEPGKYTTHTVIVEDPVDVIQRNAEGSMRIRLRAVSS